MNALLEKKAQFKKLGFQKLEAAEVVSRLNNTLASYQVFYHKLQNFHWNVVGNDFYDIHEITENLYKESVEVIDELAERVKVFGKMPMSKLSEYVENSIIKESAGNMSAEYMVSELIHDIQTLLENMLDTYEFATKNGDVGTSHMIAGMIKNLETKHWQLSAWNNQKFNK